MVDLIRAQRDYLQGKSRVHKAQGLLHPPSYTAPLGQRREKEAPGLQEPEEWAAPGMVPGVGLGPEALH